MPTFDDLSVDHVEILVSDVAASTDWLVDGYGLAVYAGSDPDDDTAVARSVGVGGGSIRLLLTQPLSAEHPATAYLEEHGDGVADIALLVPDATAAFDEAVRRGAEPVRPPFAQDGLVIAVIKGFGDVVHSFVQRSGDVSPTALPGLRPVPGGAADVKVALAGMDHFAVCVEAGELEPTAQFYRQVLDFELVFTERIVVGTQAMDSKVVQSRSGSVTFTLLEPDRSQSPGQIDDFLKSHNGSGVQHIAFSTDDIVRTVGTMVANGVEFLSTPATYYRRLDQRLTLNRHSRPELEQFGILADQDQDGQLFQIFTRSVHPRRTLFMEVIERAGAHTFGSGNITALYEAVELQQSLETDRT